MTIPLQLCHIFMYYISEPQNNIPLAAFPDYVKWMHNDMNHKFHMEYVVSYALVLYEQHLCCMLSLFVVTCTGKST